MDFITQLMKNPILMTIDIAIVSYIIYVSINFARQSQAASVLKGIAFVIIIKAFSQLVQLHALSWIIDQVITWGVIALMIIFQPEIRRYLEQIGQHPLFNGKKKVKQYDVIDDMVDATDYLSKRYIGALMCIENKSSLNNYVHTGVLLRARLSSQLLINMFTPNTPLHDGAVIIQEDQITAASCVLPLSENTAIPQELGTRHRAAIGLSEQTDALTIVVSEETGNISATFQHELYRDLTLQELRDLLEKVMHNDNHQNDNHRLTKKLKMFLVKFGGKADE